MWIRRRFSLALATLCGLSMAGCDMAEYDAASNQQTQQLLVGLWTSQRDTQHPLMIDPAGNLRLWTGAAYSPSVRPIVMEPGARSFRVDIAMPNGQKKPFAGQLVTDDRLSLQLLEKPEVGYPLTVIYARVPTAPPGGQKKQK